MLAKVARSPWPCTLVRASSLIQLSVFLASTDREPGLVCLSTRAVALRDCKRLPGKQPLVIAPALRVPQKHPARSMVDVPYPDRRVLVQLLSADLHAKTPGQ